MGKIALVSGITGQDGSFLAEQLLAKGYKVYGLIRRSSGENLKRIEKIVSQIEVVDADMLEGGVISAVIGSVKPDEIYNLAAQSFVGSSFQTPKYTMDVTGVSLIHMLEAIRTQSPLTRFYQASSSEMFGKVCVVGETLNEESKFNPMSPYAVAKVTAHYLTQYYRRAFNLFTSCGILFNHESERRGEQFVTRKISRAVAMIKFGMQKELKLGNILARRDWGYAPEYTDAMWRMLQTPEPHDYVIGTGQEHTVKKFCELAFKYVGLDWTDYVVIDPAEQRPADVNYLKADYSKAKRDLGWTPNINFEQLVKIMVDADLDEVRTLKNEQESQHRKVQP